MRILVTGGAGYIGSHFCKLAQQAGHLPVTFDNLSTGHLESVRFGPFVQGDIRDLEAVAQALREHQIEAVVHFAGRALVGESMQEPGLYYSINASGTLALVQAMQQAGVGTIVFSSSCATYGLAEGPIGEDHPQRPINPYGRSKLQAEQILLDFHQAHGLRVALLRYFNVVGQDPQGELWEDHEPETHLVPNIVKALSAGSEFHINGTDFVTPDGTCIRDYVDVNDLGRAHLRALGVLAGQPLLVSNIATGRGQSVREVLKACGDVFGCMPKTIEGPPRPGDPPQLVADDRHFRSWCKEPLTPFAESVATLKRSPKFKRNGQPGTTADR